jgi:DNA-binding MarR family transcriptional regulator
MVDYVRNCVALAPLGDWMGTLIGYVQSARPDLTNRQMALLMVVYLKDGPHTVRGLAAELKVSKPVVTRALNTLGALGYLRRQKDESDLRNVFVERTAAGTVFLEEFAALVESGAGAHGTTDRRERSSGLRVAH